MMAVASTFPMPQPKPMAFTLVELVVAVGIAGSTLLAVIALAGAATNEGIRVQEQNAAGRLRTTLDEVMRDRVHEPEVYTALRSGDPLYAYTHGADSEGNPEPFELAFGHRNRARIPADADLIDEAANAQAVYRIDLDWFDPRDGSEVLPSTLPENYYELTEPALGIRFTLRRLPAGLPDDGGAPDRVAARFHTIFRP